ncbi:hypothetical protein V8F20_003211 [Naviculisporaceae sp. PSN 640]
MQCPEMWLRLSAWTCFRVRAGILRALLMFAVVVTGEERRKGLVVLQYHVNSLVEMSDELCGMLIGVRLQDGHHQRQGSSEGPQPRRYGGYDSFKFGEDSGAVGENSHKMVNLDESGMLERNRRQGIDETFEGGEKELGVLKFKINPNCDPDQLVLESDHVWSQDPRYRSR